MNNQESSPFNVLMKYFLDNFPLEVLMGDLIPRDWRLERGKFYFESLVELNSVMEKIKKYGVYFSEFYSTSPNITEAESIEYHWHSYLHDLYILKERLVKLFGSLKNDLKRYIVLKEEQEKVNRALEHLKQKTVSGLEKAQQARGKLTHQFTLRNSSLEKAKALKFVKTQSKELNLDENKIEEKYRNLTEKTKKKYVEMASKNVEEIERMRDFFAPRFGYIFSTLNNHDVAVFKL